MVAKVQHDALEAAVGCSKIEPVAAAYKCELAMFGKKKEGWEKKKREEERERETAVDTIVDCNTEKRIFLIYIGHSITRRTQNKTFQTYARLGKAAAAVQIALFML